MYVSPLPRELYWLLALVLDHFHNLSEDPWPRIGGWLGRIMLGPSAVFNSVCTPAACTLPVTKRVREGHWVYLKKRKHKAVELLRSQENQWEAFTEQPICRDTNAFLFVCCRNVIS